MKKLLNKNKPSQQAMTLKDKIAPAPEFREEVDYIQLGENYARTFLVIDYHGTPRGNFLSKLYRFKGNLTVSTHLVPQSAEDHIKQTEKSISELKTELREDRKFAMKESKKLSLENQLKAAQQTLEKLMAGLNSKVFHVHMYLHLQASSLDELERATKRLSVTAIQRGLRIVPAKFNMIEAFKSIIPLAEPKLPEMTYRNFDSEAASSLFPYDEAELFHEGGIIKGINLTTGSLIKVDQKELPSHNEFVIGASGMGKTFYLEKDMLRKWMNGDRVFVIDPEGEISRTVKKVGGQVMKMSPMSNTIINIMEIKPTMDTHDIDNESNSNSESEPRLPLLFQKIQRLQIFFKLIKKDMGMVEQAQLEQALRVIYERVNITDDTDFTELGPKDFPVLEDLYNELEDKGQYDELKHFRQILYMYVHGSNGRMFNGHTNIDMNNDFVCFNLKELEEEADSQAAAMYTAVSFLWDEITSQHEEFIWLYVDEAHTIADPDNPRAMKFLYQIYKRIRKYNGGSTVATQQIDDFLSAQEKTRNYGKAIIGNSLSQLILPLKPQDIDDLKAKKVMDLSEEEESIISKLKRGRGIYVVGNNRVHMEVDYTPEEMRLINPKKYNQLYGKEEIAYVR